MVTGNFFPGVKQLEREVGHSPLFNASTPHNMPLLFYFLSTSSNASLVSSNQPGHGRKPQLSG
jgi:hypothetical protein